MWRGVIENSIKLMKSFKMYLYDHSSENLLSFPADVISAQLKKMVKNVQKKLSKKFQQKSGEQG